MATAQLETTGEAEAERVIRWRFDQLRQGGYDVETALALALQRDVDLHLAVDLLRRGCPAETAARILV